MTIARIIAGWGDGAIAAQKVGTQVESISFMISGGFATAINAFTAQNFGAGRYDRIQKGFSTGAVLMVAWGAFTSVVLIAFPEPLMRLFIQEADVVEIGASYLRIMGLAEIFSCLEGLASGMFQGMGHTVPPAVTGMAFNLFRIPAALLLSATALGLSGIWWAMSLSMFLKGVVLPIWFILFLRRFMRAHKAAPAAEKTGLTGEHPSTVKGECPMHLNKEEIMEIIPHRDPFLLIDEIVELEPGVRAVGKKYLKPDEFWFKGHFPPGAGPAGRPDHRDAGPDRGGLLPLAAGKQGQDRLFCRDRQGKFRNKALPGDTLTLEVEVIKARGPVAVCKATATVDGKKIVTAELTSMLGDAPKQE